MRLARVGVCLGAAFLGAGLLAGSGCREYPAAAPESPAEAVVKISAPGEPVWDFGKVKEDAILFHAFELENDRAKPLRIKDISTSCGCTASAVKKRDLKPQERSRVEVTFTAKGYSGPVRQYVYVATDDVDNPVLRYIIKADVSP